MCADFTARSSSTVDSFELARSGRRIEGAVAMERLPRLAGFLTMPQSDLRYRIEGLLDDQAQPAADLHLEGRLNLTCQRCNAPLDFELDRTTRFRFVASEEELNSLPIEDDGVDAIVGSRHMSIYDWVEDEAILSLPLVPRHDRCSAPFQSESHSDAVDAPSPFAALLALRNGGNGGTGYGR